MIVVVGSWSQPKAIAKRAPSPSDGIAGTRRIARMIMNKTGKRVIGEIQKPAFSPAIMT